MCRDFLQGLVKEQKLSKVEELLELPTQYQQLNSSICLLVVIFGVVLQGSSDNLEIQFQEVRKYSMSDLSTLENL